MIKNLVIVESPAKAKTIEGYLGKDFKVASSYGHVRDLPKDDMAVDVVNGFKPTYEVSKDKEQVVKDLKKLAKEAETIYLASDDDREGEAISWHLMEALEIGDKSKRIVFREITKNAIIKALESPRSIDLDLVNAQQARRILDRLVGFELSPVLWKKVKKGLSAGRVQSVAVRLIVEREREIESFNSSSSFKVTALFKLKDGKTLSAELPEKFDTSDEAYSFLEQCIPADFSIKHLEIKPIKKSPAAPFTTSTLQQEAGRKLGFSVSRTMSVAQRLYESGKISYMRTDSVNLSEEAIANARTEIVNVYGESFAESRRFKTKSATAQEAHEAVRPTDFSIHETGNSYDESRLYELIWKRAVASQMSDARLEKTVATIAISDQSRTLIASGEVIKFEGFLKVYLESTDDEDNGSVSEKVLPPLQIGQELTLIEMVARERFSRPSARYTEPGLVKKLEELGIGRPSTYAPTISTIQKRGYVEKESREGKDRKYRELTLSNGQISDHTKSEITGAEKNKLFPTDIAMVVNDFLITHFPNVIDYSFTATVEKEFDEIASGTKDWDKMIGSFYDGFHPKVESTENIDRAEVGKARELGADPGTGLKILAKLGKFGPYVQLGNGENEDTKPKYASLRKGQLLETITLEEALDLFKLPREIGTYEDENLVVGIGKFGPYVRHKSKFYSLGKEDDPLTVNPERTIEIINTKRELDSKKIIKIFPENPDVQVLNGPYGAYIKVEKKNVRIPKDKKAEELTLEECLDLAAKAPEKKGRGFKRKS